MHVLDADARALLFHTRDSTDPALGTCWESPGGGIAASDDRFYPGRLPVLLPRFLAGQRIEESFERWS